MFQQWLDLRRANHDQEAFKLLMSTAAAPVEPVPGTDRLARILGGTVVMGQLPLSRWVECGTVDRQLAPVALCVRRGGTT